MEILSIIQTVILVIILGTLVNGFKEIFEEPEIKPIDPKIEASLYR
jgi:hypothetical protein